MRARRAFLTLSLGFVLLAGCGDDDDTEDTLDRVEENIREGAEDAGDAADDAWATLRTGFERLVDEAATGDDQAQDELLEECRDALEDLRQADDADAERVGELCDRIRDADDETAWDELRSEFEDLDGSR